LTAQARQCIIFSRFEDGENPLSELKSIGSFIIDMDGVLYHGQRPQAGAREFVEEVERRSFPYVMVTNNSSRTPQAYVVKLKAMGIEVEEERILTSAQATAVYLKKIAPPGERIYVIGEEGLLAELVESGYRIADSDWKVDFVVVGMDTLLTYEKLKMATLAIRSGARFIACNPDNTFPSELGILPGNGAILAALEAATDAQPLVIGKPQPAIFRMAIERMGSPPGMVAVLGDRLETDILGGIKAGLKAVLLLSGVTSRQKLAESSIKPDWVFEDINAFHRAWREELDGD